MNIYGSIGFTLLKNKETKQKIIIFADMHDTLPKCKNKVNIADWIKRKFNSCCILLEEVPRDNMQLEELWLAEHTQELKNLFLNNHETVIGVDIRPSLIPYSWEAIGKIKEIDDFRLSSYIKDIDNFFCLNHHNTKKNFDLYNYEKIKATKIGDHYLSIKDNYHNYLKTNHKILRKNIFAIHKENKNTLETINDILDEIMEWFICAHVYKNSHKPIVLHAGLAHTEKVVYWLTNNYNFTIIKEQGVNKLSESDTEPLVGCINLSEEEDLLFSTKII
jgi:hypothetical protein